ncbi:hypothetical protein AKJ09_00047 [Labilithrix luteola]|uniref:Uncharacterized protein n=1 Tax=Labilithrix luteola TaxID=1391654 RepID=A0A0K1PIK8_9BACT|nr:hypothetical protein [Labilithrix luteola]AKU93383.1 hypothetical protein AKJ09_00047 [Labilithrix luteola]
MSKPANKPAATVQPETLEAPTPSTKIPYGTVELDFSLRRLGGTQGLASTSTCQFAETAGYSVELDTVTGLVSIRHERSNEEHLVPRERVLFFKPKAAGVTPAAK